MKAIKAIKEISELTQEKKTYLRAFESTGNIFCLEMVDSLEDEILDIERKYNLI